MFLLVIFLFTMQPNGDFKDFEVVTHGFDTLEECNSMGRYIAANLPESEVKSLSYCVGPDDYIK